MANREDKHELLEIFDKLTDREIVCLLYKALGATTRYIECQRQISRQSASKAHRRAFVVYGECHHPLEDETWIELIQRLFAN